MNISNTCCLSYNTRLCNSVSTVLPGGFHVWHKRLGHAPISKLKYIRGIVRIKIKNPSPIIKATIWIYFNTMVKKVEAENFIQQAIVVREKYKDEYQQISGSTIISKSY